MNHRPIADDTRGHQPGTVDYAPRVDGAQTKRWIGLAILLALAGGYGSYLYYRPQPVHRTLMMSRVYVPLVPPATMPTLNPRPAVVSPPKAAEQR